MKETSFNYKEYPVELDGAEEHGSSKRVTANYEAQILDDVDYYILGKSM